jgi:hypothetical protein
LLLTTYLTTFDATGKKLVSICVVPVVDPSELIDPITMSPNSAPVSKNVPFVVSAVLCAATTAEPKDAVAYDTLVMFGPVAPISRVPTVASPVLLIVVEAIVLIVAVLIVAVLIVAVLIVAVLMLAVAIVVVPVERVVFEPNVTGPRSVEAPSTAKVPVLLAPVVDICRAEIPASSPLEMARMVPSTMLLPNVFKSWV